MANNRLPWSEQEKMMAAAYNNIAFSFSQIGSYMKNHIKTVKNGMGIINEGDIEEILSKLTDMINKNLHNVSNKRINFTIGDCTPIKAKSPSNINSVSTATDGKRYQYESKKIKIPESQIKKIIAETTKKVLNEAKDEAIDYYDYLNILKDNNWDIVQETKVTDSNGNNGIRFRIMPNKNATSFESIVDQIKRAASNPNGIIGSIGKHRYAPEIKAYSIIIIGMK